MGTDKTISLRTLLRPYDFSSKKKSKEWHLMTSLCSLASRTKKTRMIHDFPQSIYLFHKIWKVGYVSR